MAEHYNGTESANPYLDGALCDHIHEATQEIQRRLTASLHNVTDIAYVSRVHPNTIRLIRSGQRPVAAPETLDALVYALDKLHRLVEEDL